MNHYTADVTADQSESIVGHSLSQFFHHSDRQDVESILTTKSFTPDSHFTHRWHTEVDSDLGTIYLVGEDTSEQKRIGSALTAIEQVTNTGYWEIDLDTNVLYWSDKVHEIHETDTREFRPSFEDGLRFYPPNSVEKLKVALDKLEKTGEPYELELDFITDKQNPLIVKAHGFSETLNGNVVRNFGTFEDLTQKKRDEAAVAQLEKRIMLALNAAKIGVWKYDIAHDYLEWDDRLFEIYGQDRQGFNSTLADWRGCMHPEDIQEAEAKFEYAVHNQAYFQHTFRVITQKTKFVMF